MEEKRMRLWANPTIMTASSANTRASTFLMILAALTVSLSLSIPIAHGFHQLVLPSPPRTTTTISTSSSIRRNSSRLPWNIIHHWQQLLSTIIISTSHPSLYQLSLSSSRDIVTEGTNQSTPIVEIRNIASHLASQPLESLLSSSEAKKIMNELFFNDVNTPSSSSVIFTDRSYAQYVKYWNSIESRLRREEQRTPADFLGVELTNRILSSIRGRSGNEKNGNITSNNKYDAQTVRTFLESDAINSLFTRLLYDAIFEFTTKFDILGNAISNLPLLGPVRNQVLKESKRNMDRTLGPLLRTFLSGYTRVAIRQAVEFVVSEENALAFGKANAKLVTYLLEERTVADWIPDSNVMVQWREEVWAYLVSMEGGENKKRNDQEKVVQQSIDWIYDILGDKCIEDGGVTMTEILDASPTLEMSLGRFWQLCQDSSKTQ